MSQSYPIEKGSASGIPQEHITEPHGGPSSPIAGPSFEPPPYSGPSYASHTTPIPQGPIIFPSLPRLDYSLYSPLDFTLSTDETTLTSSNPALSTNPKVLKELIQAQATLPPKVVISIRGTRQGGIIDFDVKLNMMSLFCGNSYEESNSEQWNYLRTIPDSEMGFRGHTKHTLIPKASGGIDEWIRRYCMEEAAKQFTLERIVTNWDFESIEGRLHSLIASTLYQGRVTVTCVATHNKVVIKAAAKKKDFLTSVTSLFASTKKYEVLKVIWPYATVKPGQEDRSCRVMSEDAWWGQWRDAVRHAVLSRRKGWVTAEDQLEFLMNRERDGGAMVEWGRGEYGSQ